MNFFFGLKDDKFKSNITIPRFQNKSYSQKDYYLYTAFVKNKLWHIEQTNCEYDNDFFYVRSTNIENNLIFFLAKADELNNLNNLKRLNDYNTFSNTTPAFRSNLEIKLEDKGISSYQSEYPFKMVTKTGSIMSSVYSILNNDASENYLFFRNIFLNPIEVEFKIYFIDIIKKKIIDIKKAKTNYSNLILIDKNLIKPEIYIFTNEYLGIPIYLSHKDGSLSLEHTNPLQEYVLGNEKFKVITDLKNEINSKIINENIK